MRYKQKIITGNGPGSCGSVDSFESSTQGLPQYLLTILVNLRPDNTSQEVKTKMAFKQYVKTHKIRILHYHNDNGRFSNNTFVNDDCAQQQMISYCGGKAHHQNCKVEK